MLSKAYLREQLDEQYMLVCRVIRNAAAACMKSALLTCRAKKDRLKAGLG